MSLVPVVHRPLRPLTWRDLLIADAKQMYSYQEKCADNMFENPRSGIVVIPCGGGKTLTGIGMAIAIVCHNKNAAAAAAVAAVAATHGGSGRKVQTRHPQHVMVVCNTNIVIVQWIKELKKLVKGATDVTGSNHVYVKELKKLVKGATDVPGSNHVYVKDQHILFTFTTYHAFSTTRGKGDLCATADVLLLDEVHIAAATSASKAINRFGCGVKIGLTATMLRCDDCVANIADIVGPTLPELSVKWKVVEASGRIAKLDMRVVTCAASDDWRRMYDESKCTVRRNILNVLNPGKINKVRDIIAKHPAKKIVIFIDYVTPLEYLKSALKCIAIVGTTNPNERASMLKLFESANAHHNVILLSKVADTGIDIPTAEVVIEMSVIDRSQRQMTQRVGRGVRINNSPGKVTYVYTLVNEGTQEYDFWKTRKQFLESEEYTFTSEVYSDATPCADFSSVVSEIRAEDGDGVLGVGDVADDVPAKKRKTAHVALV
jgi:DNA excision repair protein ERCC-3